MAVEQVSYGFLSEQATRPAHPDLRLDEIPQEAEAVVLEGSPKASRLSMRWAPLAAFAGVAVTTTIVLSVVLEHSEPRQAPVAAWKSIQDEALIQCHMGCQDRDHANMQCLKDCLPAKEQCMASRCSGAELGSVEFTTCAIDCHTTECAAGCAGIGAIATRCHTTCEPDRDLLLDKACARDCKKQYDDSCMDVCKDARSKCAKSKCHGTSGEALTDCEYQCTLESCGAQCQDTAQALSTCSANCYPDAGQPKTLMPASVETAAVVFQRKQCSNQCRGYDHRHIQCLRICGPKIGACMHRACQHAKPGSSEQADCQSQCEKDACGASCHKTSEEVSTCYKECTPTGDSECSQECQRTHDNSCMKTCSGTMGNCLVEQCAIFLGKDTNDYDNCQMRCMESHCGKDCAQTAFQFQKCAGKCAEASAAIQMKK